MQSRAHAWENERAGGWDEPRRWHWRAAGSRSVTELGGRGVCALTALPLLCSKTNNTAKQQTPIMFFKKSKHN